MPYKNLSDGLYLARKNSSIPGVQHYGIIDVGNRFGFVDVNYFSPPVVIHQAPPHIQYDWLPNTLPWHVENLIVDEKVAIYRFMEASNNPVYDVFNNNCEHFAKYVASGVWQSKQIQVGVTVTVATVLYLINK